MAPVWRLHGRGHVQRTASSEHTSADGSPIITLATLPALHQAVITACDGVDGLVDRQIDDPRACRFDPASLACPAGTNRADCLTPAQVDVAHKLYAGPSDPQGRRLYPGGQPLGSIGEAHADPEGEPS